jgi:hypothetical protein
MREKKIKGGTMVLDLKSIPQVWNVDKWLAVAFDTGVLIVDTSEGGKMPRMLNPRKKLKFMIKDISTDDTK